MQTRTAQRKQALQAIMDMVLKNKNKTNPATPPPPPPPQQQQQKPAHNQPSHNQQSPRHEQPQTPLQLSTPPPPPVQSPEHKKSKSELLQEKMRLLQKKKQGLNSKSQNQVEVVQEDGGQDRGKQVSVFRIEPEEVLGSLFGIIPPTPKQQPIPNTKQKQPQQQQQQPQLQIIPKQQQPPKQPQPILIPPQPTPTIPTIQPILQITPKRNNKLDQFLLKLKNRKSEQQINSNSNILSPQPVNLSVQQSQKLQGGQFCQPVVSQYQQQLPRPVQVNIGQSNDRNVVTEVLPNQMENQSNNNKQQVVGQVQMQQQQPVQHQYQYQQPSQQQQPQNQQPPQQQQHQQNYEQILKQQLIEQLKIKQLQRLRLKIKEQTLRKFQEQLRNQQQQRLIKAAAEKAEKEKQKEVIEIPPVLHSKPEEIVHQVVEKVKEPLEEVLSVPVAVEENKVASSIQMQEDQNEYQIQDQSDNQQQQQHNKTRNKPTQQQPYNYHEHPIICNQNFLKHEKIKQKLLLKQLYKIKNYTNTLIGSTKKQLTNHMTIGYTKMVGERLQVLENILNTVNKQV